MTKIPIYKNYYMKDEPIGQIEITEQLKEKILNNLITISGTATINNGNLELTSISLVPDITKNKVKQK